MPNKVALVTGGTRGIGYGIASCLADEGYDLMLCGVRDEEAVSDVLRQLGDKGHQVLYCQADVSNPDARETLLRAVENKLGGLNVLVNNAGIAPTDRKDILQATEESFQQVLRINLEGPYFLTQAAANWMIRQKQTSPDFSGCIINVSSVSATMASPNRGEYCISKAGLSMASKLWAVRLAEYDLPVYEVRPGIISTDMTSGVREKYDKLIDAGLLLQPRWGTPEDIGKTVAALVRGDLPYSTGAVITADGGLSVERL